MIPIRHNKLEEFAATHYAAVLERLQKAQLINRPSKWDERIANIWEEETLESIVLAKPEKLERLALKWNKDHNDQFQYFVDNLYKEYRSSDKWKRYNAPQLVRDLSLIHI